MTQIFLIALGGALGAALRFLTGFLAVKIFGKSDVITGTVLANITGCLLAGMLLGIVSVEMLLNQTSVVFLSIGVLGSFTTFSTFALETFLIGKKSSKELIFYLFLQLAAAFLAVVSGYEFIQLLPGFN